MRLASILKRASALESIPGEAAGWRRRRRWSGRTKRARFCIWSRCGSRLGRRSDFMKKALEPAKPVSADAIARLADQGKDISHFFKGQGRMVQPIQRVNVDV